MSSMPFVMFSTPQIRKALGGQKKQNEPNGGNKSDNGNSERKVKTNEQSKVASIGEMYKHNLKFMNSVWGLYNRYAPQAFQKNEEYKNN